MADVNQIITMGIGTPADIRHFILVGLSTEQALSNPQETTLLSPRSTSTTLLARAVSNTVKARSGALTLKERGD